MRERIAHLFAPWFKDPATWVSLGEGPTPPSNDRFRIASLSVFTQAGSKANHTDGVPECPHLTIQTRTLPPSRRNGSD
jgi:hypothetical protein